MHVSYCYAGQRPTTPGPLFFPSVLHVLRIIHHHHHHHHYRYHHLKFFIIHTIEYPKTKIFTQTIMWYSDNICRCWHFFSLLLHNKIQSLLYISIKISPNKKKKIIASMQVFWVQTFLTKRLPSPMFFNLSVPGSLRIF